MKTCAREGCDNTFVGPHNKKWCSLKCKRENEKLRYQTDAYREWQKLYREEYQKTGKWNEYAKQYRESKVLAYWIVYRLVCGYIGQTNQPAHRKRGHAQHGRTMDNYETLAICYTLEEALDLEALYQSLSDNYDTPDNNNLIKQLKQQT